jgi:DNA-binding NtrC family response regulator
MENNFCSYDGYGQQIGGDAWRRRVERGWEGMSESKVLFVDDEPEARDALCRVLLDQDYEILMASSGEEVLEILRTETVQVVVTDYMMPGMNGLELMERIKRQHPETLGIVLSAVADWDLVAGAMDRDTVYSFIAKPWNNNELLFTIRRGLELVRTRQELRRLQEQVRKLTGQRP